MNYAAFRVEQDGKNQGKTVTLARPNLAAGEVLIQSAYSSINYKDALAITGEGKILRNYPMTPGIDVAGVVIESKDSRWSVGQEVLITGCGLGELSDGGLAELVKAPGDWLVALPEGLSPREAMIYGTAGFTAAICLYRLQQNGQTPEQGPIVVTGASGGVGNFAVAILARQGYEVIAVSGKVHEHAQVLSLGAKQCFTPEDLALGKRPLESIRFAGAIDNVGGSLLEGLLRHINLWGNVASVGLASGHQFSASVMPFILRGVSLLGVSSTNCPMPLRRELWQRLSKDWRPAQLSSFAKMELRLPEVEAYAQTMLARQSTGRALVNLAR